MTGPARPIWPDGAKTAFCLTFDADGPATAIGNGRLPLGEYSHHRYMLRRGIPRTLDILARAGVSATFFCLGHDAEHFPDTIRRIHAAGHEIASHGYAHENDDLGPATAERITRAHHALADCTGEAPVGFRATGGYRGPAALPTLLELGYRYDSSEKHAELPYFPDPRLVELPTSIVALNDAQILKFQHTLAREIEASWIAEFDAIHAAYGYYMFILHPVARFGSVSPARARAWANLVAHAAAQPGTRFMTGRAMADHCLATAGQWSDPT